MEAKFTNEGPTTEANATENAASKVQEWASNDSERRKSSLLSAVASLSRK